HQLLHKLNYEIEDEKDEYPIRLIAPTCRASKRLSETAGIGASTIHRLIGWGMDTGKDEIIDAEIDAELIIIDEMSMVDTWLFYQFMRNVKPYTILVFRSEEHTSELQSRFYIVCSLIV